jgi:hypothetical protein
VVRGLVDELWWWMGWRCYELNRCEESLYFMRLCSAELHSYMNRSVIGVCISHKIVL